MRRCDASPWNLVEVAAVGLAQIVEVGGEALGALGLEDGAQSQLGLGGIPYDLVVVGARLLHLGIVVVEAEVLGNELLDILILDGGVVLHQLADGAVVDVVSQTLLGLDLVAVGNGHVVHLVAEAENEHILSVGPSGAYAHPDADLVLRLLILPVSYYDLAAQAHACADVSELAVAVCRLVEVHEIHIHRIPRNLAVVLSVEVEQGLVELLQAVNPHLGGAECVHPRDDADTLVVGIRCLERGGYLGGRVYRTFIYHLYGEFARSVETLYHLVAVSVHGYDCVAAIEQLCAGYEPDFIILKHDKLVLGFC